MVSSRDVSSGDKASSSSVAHKDSSFGDSGMTEAEKIITNNPLLSSILNGTYMDSSRDVSSGDNVASHDSNATAANAEGNFQNSEKEKEQEQQKDNEK